MEGATFPLWSEPVVVEVPKLDFLFTTVGIDCTCHSNRASSRARGDIFISGGLCMGNSLLRYHPLDQVVRSSRRTHQYRYPL